MLAPIFTTLLMPNMQMDHPMMSHNEAAEIILTASGNTDHHSSMPCCRDAIILCSLGIVFLVPQAAGIALSGGSKRVQNSNLLVQSIFLNTLSPPPKA